MHETINGILDIDLAQPSKFDAPREEGYEARNERRRRSTSSNNSSSTIGERKRGIRRGR